jgi:hypothetical protein
MGRAPFALLESPLSLLPLRSEIVLFESGLVLPGTRDAHAQQTAFELAAVGIPDHRKRASGWDVDESDALPLDDLDVDRLIGLERLLERLFGRRVGDVADVNRAGRCDWGHERKR